MLSKNIYLAVKHIHYGRVLLQNVRKKNPIPAPKEILSSILPDSSEAPHWQSIRKQMLEIGRPFTPVNMDYIIMSYCGLKNDLQLGKNYINFLQNNYIEPNLATIGQYLKLHYTANRFNTSNLNDDDEILSLYKHIKEKHKVLDIASSECALAALSLTKEWKTFLNLLDEIKLMGIPTDLCYSAIVSTAFRNGDTELAWKLFNEMIVNGRKPLPEVFVSYFSYCRQQKGFFDELTKLFHFCQTADIIFNEEVAKHFREICPFKERIKSTEISKNGTCYTCKNKLQMFKLTTEEFNSLKQHFFDNVIVGKNVFYKTNPSELERFKNFIRDLPPHDVVIDGLNVAYSIGTKQPPTVLSSLLAAAVRHFVQLNKRVLVLGRSHINAWPKQNMSYIKANATLFLTENISQDDPYLLYCALSCGKDTIMVSRDLMRSHIFLLKTPHLKSLLRRWISQIRYELTYVNKSGKVFFKYPLPYMVAAQESQNKWHIPYEITDQDNNTVIKWLCIDA